MGGGRGQQQHFTTRDRIRGVSLAAAPDGMGPTAVVHVGRAHHDGHGFVGRDRPGHGGMGGGSSHWSGGGVSKDGVVSSRRC